MTETLAEENAAIRPALDPTMVCRLSEYVQLYPENGVLIAESLVTGRHIRLPNPGRVRVLLSFVTPVAVENVIDAAPATVRAALGEFISLCLESGVLTQADGTESAPSGNEVAALEAWERHDLAFHIRSRRGRSRFPLGATWHLAGRLKEEPARRPPDPRVLQRIALERPQLTCAEETWTLTRTLESRRTRYSVAPVPLALLAELLYRCARVTGTLGTDSELTVQKVYPSGGARHSIQCYLVVERCEGLARGGYRYDAFEHQLEYLRTPDARLDQLLREAQASTGTLPDRPSVLIVLTSRFGRVSRKYQSNAYRLVLQEVGAIFQTFYLVAETLGLSASALGGGDSEQFSKAFGTDFFAEPSVGEMQVGGAPHG